MKCWRRAERRIAEILGGERVPVSGRGRGDAPDVTTPSLAVEVKSRRVLPAWIKDAVAQAEASAQKPQLPLVVLHEDRRRYRDAIVMLRLDAFVRRLECKCYAPDDGAEKEE